MRPLDLSTFFTSSPMSLLQQFDPCSLSSIEDDLLIKKILQTHDPDPDGRELDSSQLLLVIESTMHFISPKFSYPRSDCINSWNFEVFGFEGKLGYTVNKISHRILCKCYEDGDLHAETMMLFETLGPFKWDAKVVLTLAALVSKYGELWLIMQLVHHNSLAALTAALKQMPRELNTLNIQFKALNLLFDTMIEAANLVLEFEGLPLQQQLLDDEAIVVTKSKMYITIYWILRSSISCAPLIADFRTMKDNQVHVFSLHLLIQYIILISYSGSYFSLHHMDCIQLERRFPEKIRHLFELSHCHNQEVLHVLFSSTNDLPLKDSSREKYFGIQELENKVVILLISKPELMAVEKIFYLVHQMHDHPLHKKIGASYAILWVPIPSSHTWNLTDEMNFKFLSNSLPWFSIRCPWLLHSAVINFIRKEWSYKEEPIMVVLSTDGVVTNLNAIDMVWLWGAKAFPFSASREKELWEQENKIFQLLIDGIDPFLTNLVDEGKHICFYGSDKISWIRDFNNTLQKIKNSMGIQLEAIYVGYRNPLNKDVGNILDISMEENSSIFLSTAKMKLFWLRLESIKNSVARLDQAAHYNSIIQPLLDACETSTDWMIIGKGSSTDIIILKGRQVQECLNLVPEWAQKVAKLGLFGAIRCAMESPLPVKPCYHNEILQSEEGLTEEFVFCSRCKRPVEKFVVYQCNVTESAEE
ncbi:PREDICTED: protein SIEVE ELEMENT OCCLUSION C [Nicotiana attenuata]|uniref:protein SIEVE ELEMENT OCCLUSION C n=1 Tax=Nicotiana attenuata TaxID=49451 RepID=UPI000904731A|nr:PREDICTED: protein SIEVE ELEMENT OCCLUSION C [Nicotiana attenuata]